MSFIKRYSLAFFFVLTFVITWGAASLVIVFDLYLTRPVVMIGFTISVFAPSLSAIFITALSEGKDGLKILLQKTIFVNTSLLSYVVAFSPVILSFLAVIFYFSTGGTPGGNIKPIEWWDLLYLTLFLFLTGPLGEELGWRGFALPRLQKYVSPLLCGIIIGIIWALWHLPAWFIPGSYQSQFPYYTFALSIIFQSIIMTWLFIQSKGSIFMVILFHYAINFSGELIKDYLDLISVHLFFNYTTILYFFLALLITLCAGKSFLRKPKETHPLQE